MRSSAASLLFLLACIAACADDLPLSALTEVVAESATEPRLSLRGVYSDLASRTPAQGAIEFTPDHELWSDGATKRRWLILPPGGRIDTSNMDHWQFPVGTTLVKEFSREGQPIETRVVQRIGTSGEMKTQFFMGAFVWNEARTDALFTKDGVPNALGTTHDVPMQDHCIQCHQGEPSAVLGFSAVQLSRSGMLTQLAEQGVFTVEPGRTFAMRGSELAVRALGMIHANCGHCHGDSGIGSLMRLQFIPSQADLPLEQTQIYRTTLSQPITDWMPRPAEFEVRIEPGDPERSAFYYRMTLRSGDGFMMNQMPPLATEVRNDAMLDAVRTWIASMPRSPRNAADGGPASAP